MLTHLYVFVSSCFTYCQSPLTFFVLLTLAPLGFTLFFFLNDTAPTEIYTLPLHDALPISLRLPSPCWCVRQTHAPASATTHVSARTSPPRRRVTDRTLAPTAATATRACPSDGTGVRSLSSTTPYSRRSVQQHGNRRQHDQSRPSTQRWCLEELEGIRAQRRPEPAQGDRHCQQDSHERFAGHETGGEQETSWAPCRRGLACSSLRQCADQAAG